jgi:phosphoadenosine phosphosulfate reductase
VTPSAHRSPELPFPDVEHVATVESRAFELETLYGNEAAQELLCLAICDMFPGRVALVSSFGAESAVLLHMVAEIRPDTPVISVDTGRLFGETRRYRELLAERLGLTDLRVVSPDPVGVSRNDPDDLLFARNPDRCCAIRKAQPLSQALAGFDAWITGRKAAHGYERKNLRAFESDGRHIKVNPLHAWDKAAVDDYFKTHGLPRHPLEGDGFLSIGCMPCTDRVWPGEGLRDGRWRGLRKTECGIHARKRG